MKRNWAVTLIVIVILWHYRTPLLALWRASVAPALAGVLPPSVAALIGAGPHPLDIPSSSRRLLNGADSVTGNNGAVGDQNSLAGGPNGFPGGFTGFGGSGGGTIDYSYLAAGSTIAGTYPDGSKSRCSTHATDGKMLCA